ncbi:hypothetical protein D1614_00640 [Maribellus luteus]|uniref:DUF5018 domain-containing protein n=1 Tax=Maribellus luteus TaxID=2305463 RepID=A0A399T8E9_9BACT|nr:hypothetical protein [Maribellus luteus]RIJ50477.1 hypothetical protein D1614_00640 [Maribellus luteus]
MKKQIFNLFYALALLAIVTACSDDDDPIDLPVYGDATMTSFGFYVEDNEGVILKDYVAEGITGDFTVSVPDYVNKTALVARFVVSENDTVYVNNVQQESGVTANDFSAPLDYIVSEGTNNTKYTVTVANLPAAVWSLAASDTTDLREFSMRVNPVTNVPYLAYALDMDDSADEKVGVFKLDGNTLVNVGAKTVSEGRASYPRIAFDAEGAPFISYADYTNNDPYKEGSTTYAASVMNYNGSSWSYVGNKGITDVRITYNDIVLKNDGNPMLFCYNNAAGTLARRELNISDFTGNSWASNLTIPGRASTQYAYHTTAKNVDGVIYLGVYNANEGTFSVYKNTDGSWTTIVESYLQDGATTGNLRDFDMDVDRDGNVFVCVADDEAGADIYRPKVLKYDATAETWSKVGTPIAIDFSTTREFSLAISPVGTPFLMYRDDSMFPVVVSFDEDTQDWTTPAQLNAVEAENLYMDFAPNGVAYAAFTTSATGETMLFKYDIPAE